jgi:hypothetical protein
MRLPLVVREKVFFSLPPHWWSERLFSCFIGNFDGTVKSQNLQQHVCKNNLLRSKRRRSRGFLRERQL